MFDFWGRSFGFVKAMQTCDHAADLIFAGFFTLKTNGEAMKTHEM